MPLTRIRKAVDNIRVGSSYAVITVIAAVVVVVLLVLLCVAVCGVCLVDPHHAPTTK